MGAILELDIDDTAKNIISPFTNSSNQYWYDLSQKDHPDLYTIRLDKGFDVHLIYNYDKIRSVKIVDLV